MSSRIKILHLSSNEYETWLTYCSEYINEALAARTDVALKTWGNKRPNFVPGLTGLEVVKELYQDDYPDVIIVDSSMAHSADINNRRLLVDLEELNKKSLLVWRTADPWRFTRTFQEHIKTVSPHIWLTHFEESATLLNSMIEPSRSNVYVFPFAVGRRYFNMNLDRKYDLALIGRCELNGELLTQKRFRRQVDVFSAPPLSEWRRKIFYGKNLKHFMNLVYNLNRCRFSWNSAVRPKGSNNYTVSLRFVEAPACGTISLTPFIVDELKRYYFPESTYVECGESLDSAIRIIKDYRVNPEKYEQIRERAYQVVMANHQMSNRMDFLMEVVKGNRNVDVRDFYQLPLDSFVL